MADLPNYGNPDRNIEQALLALKKGSQLVKYSRKRKPKVCPFRVSSDEASLVWFSHKKERTLRLASVIRIIPGQRTAVFKRYLRPEKDYLSFSLIYNNGERSLDLICKDQAELEVWFAGLNALISSASRRRSRGDGQSDRISCSDDGDFGRPYGTSLDISSSISRSSNTNVFFNRDPPTYLARSDVGSDHANMLRVSNGDVGRVSVSSAPSCSSQGSGPDDIESLGDVYVWGEIWCDGTSSDGGINSSCSKTDALIPRPLKSNVVLDVHQIACGFRHAALVTRQGEVFTWGDESGGRLGHGTEVDTTQPHLVDTVTVCNVDTVSCGEYHTCAISTVGDLFTWGDGIYNVGLLGHGTAVSHWIPKRVSGPLEGVQVLSVACGTWHTALTTLNGKVFTFGDGTFGILGHGDRESVAFPKEVESLSGLRTVRVACGVWHTAAIVEVLGQAGVNVISRKLFTWGDGDKYRLGHGDKEAHLVPTCVPSLIDYNFHQLACGDGMTVALTTSGHVMTWGSTIHGQLGIPQSDGKLPCVVQDRLSGELIEEIACGAYHVIVLTSRSEVYTWGRGANGRLGHGDVEDRMTPTLVESLKDRHVKSISCGSNFTACICIHKWVSGADQSLCSGCRQPFGFTRKRHNCYNCGLVHCHACSSRKMLRAALAPTPSKPHRVCDSCYAKLKAAESGISTTPSKVNVVSRQSIDIREKLDRGETRSSKLILSYRPGKNEMKQDSFSQVPSILQLKDIAFPSSLSALQTALKPIVAPTPPLLPFNANSKPSSPYAGMLSPPPIFSGGIVDSLKMTNELLDKEVIKLQAQVKNLKHKCELQEISLKKSEKKAEEATSLAAEESAKCNTVAKFIKSIEGQDITLLECVDHYSKVSKFPVADPRVQATLARAGFLHISRLAYIRLDHALITSLVERWRPETCTFHMRVGEMTITLQDVAVLLGLRVDGPAVTGSTAHDWPAFCQMLLGVVPDKFKGGAVTLNWLWTSFPLLAEDATQVQVERYTRAYILQLIGGCLFPDRSRNMVHMKWLPLLGDLDACGTLSWGSAVLAYLYDELSTLALKERKMMGGCLTLLQLWSWSRLSACSPTLMQLVPVGGDKPFGCRYNVPRSWDTGPDRSIMFYRNELDLLDAAHVQWCPYAEDMLQLLPEICTAGSAIWRARTPMICFDVVQMHVPDRVMRQFGLAQHIPGAVERIPAAPTRGRAEDWSLRRLPYIQRWNERANQVFEEVLPHTDLLDYERWYWRITRRWILIECPPLATYVPRGPVERDMLKDVDEKVPPDVGDSLKAVLGRAESLLKDKGSQTSKAYSSRIMDSSENGHLTNEGAVDIQYERTQYRKDESELQNALHSGSSVVTDSKETTTGHHSMENSSTTRGVEVIEQFEPGVYVTVMQSSDGTTHFRRVRFSKRRFAEQQAEEWWKANQERVFKKYSYRRSPSIVSVSSPSSSMNASNDPKEDGASPSET